MIGVFTQREASVEEPLQDDLYPIGVATHIHKMFKLPDGSLRLIVQGLARVRLDRVVQTPPVPARRGVARPTKCSATRITSRSTRCSATSRATSSRSCRCRRCCRTTSRRSPPTSPIPGKLADFIASSLTTIGTPIKQEVLETLDIRARMDSLNRILIKELEVLELGSKIQSQVQSEVGKNQREYFLREQLKAIQKELGEGDDQAKEIDELRAKIDAAGMPEGGQEGGAARARSAVEDAGRRGRVHRVAHLPRLAGRAAVGEAHRGRRSTCTAPRRSSTPTTRASRRSRTASSSTSRCAS